MKKTVWLLLGALLLGACAPRTTTQPTEAPEPQQDRYSVQSMIEAFLAPVLEGNIDYMLEPAEVPKPQQDRHSVKSMIEAFLAPVLEGNIDYMLADENRKCYGIIGKSGADDFKLRQLLADPQKRDAVLDELRKSAQDVKSRIYGIEIEESEEIQSAPPRPNTLYTVWLYARVDSFPKDVNRSFMIVTELDGPRNRLCAVEDYFLNSLIDLYWPYIFSIVDKYGQ